MTSRSQRPALSLPVNKAAAVCQWDSCIFAHFLHLPPCFHDGSGRGGAGQGPVQLLDLSGRPEGPRDHPLRPQLLLGMY